MLWGVYTKKFMKLSLFLHSKKRIFLNAKKFGF